MTNENLTEMRLLDVFALKAMQSLILKPEYENPGATAKYLAKDAYSIAQGMIEESNLYFDNGIKKKPSHWNIMDGDEEVEDDI